ncbi:response regulator transcription factor [soil metagenome]
MRPLLKTTARDDGAVPSGTTVAVVEDDRAIGDLVEHYLRRDGHAVVRAVDGESALALVATDSLDLLILDVGLPGGPDGFEVCRQLRSPPAASVPVILLTARGTEVDRVVGLELGADDYLSKPFSPRELMARVKAVLRRSKAPPHVQEVLVVGGLEVDVGRREVRLGGAIAALATREFDLLAHLARHPGRVLSRRHLLDGAWGPGWVGDERTVDVHVRQLRRKLPGLDLTTVWGVGYRLG